MLVLTSVLVLQCEHAHFFFWGTVSSRIELGVEGLMVLKGVGKIHLNISFYVEPDHFYFLNIHFLCLKNHYDTFCKPLAG